MAIFTPPRMSGWWLISLVLLGVVWLVAPQQLPVVVNKLSLISIAAVVGFHIDAGVFPYARVGDLKDRHPHLYAAAQLRRAVIIAAAMIGVSLGV